MALILDAMLVLRLYRGNNPWTLGVGCENYPTDLARVLEIFWLEAGFMKQ